MSKFKVGDLVRLRMPKTLAAKDDLIQYLADMGLSINSVGPIIEIESELDYPIRVDFRGGGEYWFAEKELALADEPIAEALFSKVKN